jgi:hypothetical protein
MKASAPRFALATWSLIAGIGPGIAAEGGPLEARDMLELAILALKGDEATALEMFNRGHPAFKRGDLYVYCADAFYREDYFTKVGKLTCGVGYYSTKVE